MRQRLTTTLAATAAAGLSALAVTVAAPAANDGAGEDKVVRSAGPTPDALISCLERHGATGLPGADEDAGRALKQWIVAKQGDASLRDALKACDVYFDEKRPEHGDPDGAATCPAPAPADAKKRALKTRSPAT